MTANASTFLQMLFNIGFSFWNGIYLTPLGNVTPLALLIASTTMVVVVKFIKRSLEDASK